MRPSRKPNTAAEQLFPGWEAPFWKQWTPPDEFKNAARFGRLEVALATFAEKLPKDPRLSLPGPADFTVPLTLVYPRQGSILFETGKTGGNEAVAAINNIIFRLLSTTPPGKLTFTIFDPVGLGQNFAALMHLADYEESYINSRIWTQTAQFEEKLAELNEHMEKVIQMYLRNEYATISEYNAEAGAIAEKYHFLVIASFPVNFSETAARRLRNIAASGARCGVYTLIQWDQRQAPPQEFVPDELRKNSVCLTHTEKGFDCPPGARREPNCFWTRRRRRKSPPIFSIRWARAARIPAGSRCLLRRSRRRMPIFGRKTRPMNFACPLAVPAPPNCNTSPLARPRASTA